MGNNLLCQFFQIFLLLFDAMTIFFCSLFSIHNVHCYYIPIFRWPSRIFWRVRFCSNNIFCKPLTIDNFNIINFLRNIKIIIAYWFYWISSFHVSCGFQSTNQENSACHGGLIGYVYLTFDFVSSSFFHIIHHF